MPEANRASAMTLPRGVFPPQYIQVCWQGHDDYARGKAVKILRKICSEREEWEFKPYVA